MGTVRRRVPETSEELDGMSFSRRVTNLVNIYNAISSIQPNDSSQTNADDSLSQPNADDISSEADQVDPRVLKKALEECIEEIKISADRIKELNLNSTSLLQFTFQVWGFFLVFQTAMLALGLNQTTVFNLEAMFALISLSTYVASFCFIAIIINAISTRGLRRKMYAEEIRLKIFKRYKRKLLQFGVDFVFHRHREIPVKPINRLFHGYVLYYTILVSMTLVICLCVIAEVRVTDTRKSAALASAAAPAPAPVQSGTGPGKTWCVAKAGSPDIDLMNGLNFACGEGGVDCGPIRTGGACFSPDTIVSHASFAYNSYYQNMGRNPSNCYFGGTSVITITTPSYMGCSFL